MSTSIYNRSVDTCLADAQHNGWYKALNTHMPSLCFQTLFYSSSKKQPDFGDAHISQ